MRINLIAGRQWTGRSRAILRCSDGPPQEGLAGVVVPEGVGQTVTVAAARPARATTVIVSLGKQADVTVETLRRGGGALAGWLRSTKSSGCGLELPRVSGVNEADGFQAVVEGLLLGAFQFEVHRSRPEKRPHPRVDLLLARVTPAWKALLRRTEAVCAATNAMRALAHEPPNVVNPISLAHRVRSLARDSKLRCTVLDDKKLAALGLRALLAVGQGSATPARLIVVEHHGSGAGRPVVLVGKAITFDSGGYALKPRESITGMKYDKCGGLAVLGAVQVAAAWGLRTPVVGIIAAAENMIAGHAYRPDDIIRTLSGKTVEVTNPDAEGRLVLCDALTYAQRRYRPRYLIDVATLTGGVVVALGREAAGLFCNHEQLQEALLAAGQRVHERLWPLPVWDEYLELIKGEDADLKNSGNREAHPVQGAIFLKQFVESGVPWAHLDIAGTAALDKAGAYCPKGATGFGVRLLSEFLRGLER